MKQNNPRRRIVFAIAVVAAICVVIASVPLARTFLKARQRQQAVEQPRAAQPSESTEDASRLSFDTYNGYFVANTFEPDAHESFAILRGQKEFDRVLGVAMVMGDKSHRLPKAAFESSIVLLAVKRGNAVWEYKVDRVTQRGGTIVLRYSTSLTKSESATFACPLIVSIPKGDYQSVQFVENGKAVRTLGFGPSH
ncbi:MAG: hypothetical protein ABFC63_05045 [Thermoguttaceae bacterium]